MTYVKIGRLAFRAEGDFWNAYWTPRDDDMTDALLLGSIRMSSAQHLAVKKEFMDLMRHAFSVHVDKVVGMTPEWGETKPAPESERSGNA